MNANLFSIVLTAITTFLLGCFVFIKNPTSKINRIFAIYCFCISEWSTFFYFNLTAPNELLGLRFSRIMHIGAIFIPVFFVNFIAEFLNLKKKVQKQLSFAYMFGFVFLIFDCTPLFIPSVSKNSSFKYFTDPSILYSIHILIFAAWVSYGLFLLYSEMKNSQGTRKNQLKYLFWGSLLGYIGGGCNYWAAYRMGPLLFPYGNYFIPIYTIITAYAILRHQFMDITIVIRKTAVYSILATIITITYFLVIYIVEGLFRGYMGYKSIPLTLSVIVMFTLIFQPLKDLVQNFVDKYFFKTSQSALKEELIKAQDELKRAERLKAVGMLAAGMAHEIKNPLTGIKTFTAFLHEKYQEPGFIEKFQDLVGSEVNKINDIVQQLLDFSKPKILKLEYINIHTLIDQLLSFLNNDLITHNIKATREYDPTLTLLSIDPNQVKQVFLNLFLNSIDAMKQGGVLTITTKLINTKAHITIADTGTGMFKKDLEHIFDPFYSTKEAGTGLGMSIVYGIIKEHNGEITVKSEVGNGTKFNIRLPISIKHNSQVI